MKLLSLALLSLLSTSIFANPLYSTQNAAKVVGGVTVAPTAIFSTSANSCVNGTDITGHRIGVNGRTEACVISAVLLTSSTVLVLKEEVQHVEADAYAFLAGEEMTFALEEVIAKAKEEVSELQKESDETVVAFLISL